ncbi:uncharacterized protein MCYG_01047 [Microsporum canis CBS 113480]|uniref:Uncharacterized protein n=1 Tax=Arthroderma otae (strain ATCC MYA-4605 / CBS 113480) TaxID=554155 RepID=C5FEC5_ARTOC|nr:uncharacterized protein MCYG_01047 [Microsporum canis CBS 113480]EEQ28159.1 predicted protein [Microsporum canis CBS 113480]
MSKAITLMPETNGRSCRLCAKLWKAAPLSLLTSITDARIEWSLTSQLSFLGAAKVASESIAPRVEGLWKLRFPKKKICIVSRSLMVDTRNFGRVSLKVTKSAFHLGPVKDAGRAGHNGNKRRHRNSATKDEAHYYVTRPQTLIFVLYGFQTLVL